MLGTVPLWSVFLGIYAVAVTICFLRERKVHKSDDYVWMPRNLYNEKYKVKE